MPANWLSRERCFIDHFSMTEKEEQEELVKTLIGMARIAKIYAVCPICKIQLNLQELENATCDKCGPFTMEETQWFSMENQASC